MKIDSVMSSNRAVQMNEEVDVATSVELTDEQLETLLKGFSIPPQPRLLLDVQVVYPDLDKMGALIARDPGVSAGILKTVNSALFGLRNPVSSVKQAVTLLGLETVVNIINASLLKASYSGMIDFKRMDLFWQITDEVAMVAGLLAKKQRLLGCDTAHLAGLFHNCGIPLLIQKHADYLSVLEQAYQQSEKSISDYEMMALGTCHADLGYFVSRSWKLPIWICEVIRDHHSPDQIERYLSRPDSEKARLMVLLKAAEYLCQEYHFLGRSNVSFEWDQHQASVLNTLGMSELEFEDLKEDIMDEAQQAMNMD
jgi:HD-like signal output (HDOD) protein